MFIYNLIQFIFPILLYYSENIYNITHLCIIVLQEFEEKEEKKNQLFSS